MHDAPNLHYGGTVRVAIGREGSLDLHNVLVQQGCNVVGPLDHEAAGGLVLQHCEFHPSPLLLHAVQIACETEDRRDG